MHMKGEENLYFVDVRRRTFTITIQWNNKLVKITKSSRVEKVNPGINREIDWDF